MVYISAFLHGILSIFAPCILFMIPLYSYYIYEGTLKKKNVVAIALGTITSLIIVGFIYRSFIVSLSYFIQYRYIIIVIMIIYALKEFGLFKIKLISIPMHNSKITFLVGMAVGIAWIPCISYFYFPITLASSRLSLFQSLILFLIYIVGLFIPLTVFTLFENKLLQKIKTFSIRHQNIIKVISFIILVVGVLIAYFTSSYYCFSCINLI